MSPDRGLYTAIVGGFVVSLLSGSRFQIGGPAGAFIVLVSATAARFGVVGLVLSLLFSGALLTLAGLLRLGSLIRHIPHAVTVGFTCGIAVTILASQLKDLGGLKLSGPEPGPLIPKLGALGHAMGSVNPAALALGYGVTGLIFLIRRCRPNWPGMLIALCLAAGLAVVLHLPLETIGSRFGGIPHIQPAPRLPAISLAKLLAVLPTALSFTLLGGVESLLAVAGQRPRGGTAEHGTGRPGDRQHGLALFGGKDRGDRTIATGDQCGKRWRTRSLVAGLLHAPLFLLAFMLVAAPSGQATRATRRAGRCWCAVCWGWRRSGSSGVLLGDWRGAPWCC